MVLGAFAAIGQNNIKRLLAYSSIGHMGFALVGLAAANEEGVRGIIVYMAIYLFMTLGSFACVMSMRTKNGMVENISDLAGLSKTNPMMAFLFTMLLFSLAGVPPLAGFFAKYVVFLAAIKANLLALAIIGVLASVVGAFYYIRIIKVIYFDEPTEAFEPMPGVMKVVLAVTGAFVIFYVLYPAPLVTAAGVAAKSLF
jgi:NADH-quinone oxidoreductase subunit N